LKRTERRTNIEDTCVLVVDDEADIRELLEYTLVRMGLAVDGVGTVKEAIETLKQRRYALCLTDMRLPDGEGLEVLRYAVSQHADLPVAVITAHGSTENAVAALKLGAFDYLSKPIGLEQLRALVKSALDLPGREAPQEAAISPLLGESPGIANARVMIGKLARSQAPIYVSGESGSGKELAARLIHAGGARRAQLFVPVNCGAIPENLMESEFFGYKKGAFTGAEADRDGFFQAANGGTLFLDEVADLPLAMQVKLLRAIQEKKVRKVGATGEDAVDVRIICATHQNLAACVESGKFRQDLYYRLNVIELKMPALRECREDITPLASSILTRLARLAGIQPPQVSPAAVAALGDYHFPGNVRELENILERAVALTGGEEIHPEDLQLSPAAPAEERGAAGAMGAKWPLQDYLDRVEREAILEALERTRFNRTAAAKILGITFRALRYRMERLGIN
jgi:two-component system response regulator PilR (NtrC family)